MRDRRGEIVFKMCASCEATASTPTPCDCVALARKRWKSSDDGIPSLPTHADCECELDMAGMCSVCETPLDKAARPFADINIPAPEGEEDGHITVCAKCIVGFANFSHACAENGTLMAFAAGAHRDQKIVVPKIITPDFRKGIH
jgi:hypothetical protein